MDRVMHSGTNNDKYFEKNILKTVLFNNNKYNFSNESLFCKDFNGEDFCKNQNYFEEEVNNIGFYFIKDSILRGSGFIIRDGDIIYFKDLIPSYVRDQIGRQDRWDLVGNRKPPISASFPVIVVAGDSHTVYGHWLVDILPRIWLYKQFFGEIIPGSKYAIPIDTPEYALKIMKEYFLIFEDEIIYYDVRNLDIESKKFIVPSLIHIDHQFHPLMNLFVSYIIGIASSMCAQTEKPVSSKIFVSRKHYRESSTSYQRKIENELDVMNVMNDHGFEIVYPETMPWSEQVMLFAGAEIIVGEAGSGLHNAIFADFGSKVLCFNPVNQVQGTIAKLRNQSISYLSSDIQNNSFTVDIVEFDRLIKTLY